LADPLGLECVVEAEDVAGLRAAQLGVQARPELPRADRVEVVLTGETLDLGAVLGDRDVYGHEVAVERRALDGLELSELTTQPFDPRVNLFVGDLRGRSRGVDTLVLVFAQLQPRADLDGRGEDAGLAGLKPLDGDLGVAAR